MTHAPRAADPADVAPLARLWHDGWHEGHAAHIPATIVAQRTVSSFAERLTTKDIRVAGPVGDPLGFCAIDGSELDQLFVSPRARGTGLALTLLRDGEARLAANGVTRAKLFCLDGNDVAARFYTRAGWDNMGVFDFPLSAITPPASVPCIRFECDLTPRAATNS